MLEILEAQVNTSRNPLPSAERLPPADTTKSRTPLPLPSAPAPAPTPLPEERLPDTNMAPMAPTDDSPPAADAEDDDDILPPDYDPPEPKPSRAPWIICGVALAGFVGWLIWRHKKKQIEPWTPKR